MSALIFSCYALTGNEGADFIVGSRPALDEYDGFFDQALDGVKLGDQLSFLLDEGRLDIGSVGASPNFRSRAACRELRDRLGKMSMITGHFVGLAPYLFNVERREAFFEVVQRKSLPPDNEVVAEVARYKQYWESTRDGRRKMGRDYRFRFVCALPRSSSVERAISDGLGPAKQLTTGLLLMPPVVFYSSIHRENCLSGY